MLTHGSLFTGIGGIDLGLERAGIKTIWQMENDGYATKVLERHWPDVRRYGDIKAVEWESVERPDIISGGFPCQDISQAGKGLGIVAGKRSSLWFEFAKAVGVLRSRYVIVENVAALPKRGLDIVLAGLAKEGYDAEWFDLRASDFGAWHKRERIFIIAHSNNSRCLHGQSEVQSTERRLYAQHESEPGSSEVSYSTGQGLERSFNQEGQIARCGYWEVEPDVGRVVDGIPDRVDRIKCLGNAVVPQVAEYIGRRIVEFDKAIDSRRKA